MLNDRLPFGGLSRLRGFAPMFVVGVVLAVGAVSSAPRLFAQDQGQKTQAEEIDALRKQVQALTKEVEQLKRQLVEERRRADEQAASSLRQARQALDDQLSRLVRDNDKPRPANLRGLLLRQALAFYQEIVTAKDDGAAARQEKAHAFQRIGEIQQQLGKLAEAEKSCRQSIALWEQLLKESPSNAAYRRNLAGAYRQLSRVLQSTGRPTEANAAAERAKAIEQSLDKAPK